MAIHPKAQNIALEVKYEFQAFQSVYAKITAVSASTDQPTENILLEDFLLHARILCDFFVQSPKDDDVSAQHFF